MSRDNIASAIQASAAEDEDLNGAVLTGWVMIAEFVSPSGSRWISRMAGDAMGNVPPTWSVKGWLVDSLDDMAAVSYFSPGDEDEDDEGLC